MESLFSLEVVINYVKLNSISTVCLFPCVAFRLLDYPTIAVNLLDDYDCKQIKSKFQLDESFNQIEKLPCFTELLDKHGRFLFSRGKSCLFRADLEILRGHLKSTPMYLMLLDTFFQPFKLVGTSLINLFNLINGIYNETESRDSNKIDETPCMKMTHGIFEIKNLLGEELGHVSFACRLTSYGTSLLPHIETTATEAFQRQFKKALKEKNVSKFKEKETKLDEATEESSEVYVYQLAGQKADQPKPKPETTKQQKNALVQTLKIDYKDAQIQINRAESKLHDRMPVEMATHINAPLNESKETKAIKPTPNIYSIKHIPDENAFQPYCPPALHYNSKNEETRKNHELTSVLNQHSFEKNRIQYLNQAAIHIEDINDLKNELDDDQSSEKTDDIILNDYFVKDKQPIEVKTLNLDQMPLLKCLLEEMSLIKNMLEKNTEPQNSMPIQEKPQKPEPNLVGILRNQPNKNKTMSFGTKEATLKSVNRLSNPKKSLQTVKKPIPSSNPHDEMPVGGGGVKKAIKKEKKPPLKYGTTNSHRMRVLANNPNKINEINQKHDQLMSQIKENIDSFNSSNTVQTFNESLGNNLEKVLFESTAGSNMSQSIQAAGSSLQKTNKTMNLSLLNKVELDSTNDNTINFRARANESDVKTVQFGNTYVLNHSFGPNSEENSTAAGKNSENSSSQRSKSNEDLDSTESNKEEEKSGGGGYRNIFLENKNYDDDDFHSSLDSSITSTKHSNSTTSNFFSRKKELQRQSSIQESNHEHDNYDDYEDDFNKSLSEMEYLKNVNYSDMNRSLSKYSSGEFKSFIDESLSMSRSSSKS